MAEKSPRKKPGLLAAAIGGLVSHPTGSVGGLVMTATALAILSNALLMQSGTHPAPLFVGTRPWTTADRAPAAPAAPTPSRPASATDAVDHGLVADIQRALTDYGYYRGDIDGLTGPQTSQAILAFERAFHLAPTGEPTNSVLLALRSVRPKSSGLAEPAGTDPMTVAALPNASAGAAPLPPPKPGRAPSADGPPVAAAPVAPVASAPAAVKAPPADPIAALIGSSAPPKAQPAVLRAPEAAQSPPVVKAVATETAAPTAVRPAAVAPAPVVAAPVAATAPAATSPVAEAVDPRLARIQQSLAKQGFGPLEVDGRMSTATREAIRQFEAYHGLDVTGSINEAFLDEMIRVGGLKLD